MIVRHGTLWAIVMVLVLLVSLSSSVKLRKPRKRLTTTRIPYQQSRIEPVIIRVMHKYPDDGFHVGCTKGKCRIAHGKHNVDVNKAISEEDSSLSDKEALRYVVHPKEYEHFVLKKNTGHGSRYKRDSAFPGSHTLNAGNDVAIAGVTDANRTSANGNATGLVRVPLYRVDKYRRVNPTHRTKRSLAADYFTRGNDSYYYAQRKAVMDRYYARQREINARYVNRTGGIPRPERNDVSQHRPVMSNASLFEFGYANEYANKDPTTRDSGTFRYPFVKLDPIYSNESRYNGKSAELASRRNVAPEINLDFRSDADVPQSTRSSSDFEGNALDLFVTPTPCTNISLSGTFAPKTRESKNAENCTQIEQRRSNEDLDYNSTDSDNSEGRQRWGRCKGEIVYQHNLLLGLTGPSNLNALFEVIIQGPVCITCVEALRYNETRATVTLDSGGRGHDYAKLRLQGYENEGFSYIIKVWGVKKISQVCDNVD
ncbi:hypothetical protein P5V15_003637 [Pogonomyrmex californicus]